MPFELFDLDQVFRVERQRRVEAVRLVRAVAARSGDLAAFLHAVRFPRSLEVPVVVTEIKNVSLVLTRRKSAVVVDHCTGRTGVAFELGLVLFLGLRDDVVHVDVDRCFEETGLAAVVILERSVLRII